MLWIALFLALQGAGPPSPPGDGAPPDVRRARDGNVAIEEELAAARKAATVEAYDLFIARHPDHPLARIAREERQRLLDEAKQPRS